MNQITKRLIHSMQNFLRLTCFFLFAVVGLRIFEWIVIQVKLSHEINVTGLELAAIPFDILMALRMCSLVLILHIIISIASSRTALIISQAMFGVLLFIQFCFIQYFSITLLPLGADLFGYSKNDVIETIAASTDVGWFKIILTITLLTALVFGWRRFSRVSWFTSASAGTTVICLLFLFISWALPAQRPAEDFDRDLDFYVAENKAHFFQVHATEYLQQKDIPVPKDLGYPWMHQVNYNSDLSKYLPANSDTLNFVFIIVEGLGRDFTGPGAPYGGFTPFLDSLAQKSFYWTNFTSNAGRTFGALPSILGSLPYGTAGFMDNGPQMPDHQTLASLLKAKGYELNFFYGGNSNFDNQDIFLEYNGFDNIIDQSKFPTAYERSYPPNGWGFPDAGLFEYASEVIQSSTRPRLDIFLTLSTHEPFRVPDARYDSLFDRRLTSLQLTDDEKQLRIDNREIFGCLLYTDDAIRRLFQLYSKRKGFNKTVFIITGDHRLIPIPSDNKLKRFHVPLYFYVPGAETAAVFRGLGSHSSITPTVLGMLKDRHGWSFPPEMPFISGPLSFSKNFESHQHIALIRNKNDIRDYVDREYFLSDDRLFRIKDNLELEAVKDDEIKSRLTDSLRSFRRMSRMAYEENRIDRTSSPYKPTLFAMSVEDQKYLETVVKQPIDDQFRLARQLALDKDYKHARVVARNILNGSPNYADARVLLARSYAWDGMYDSARLYLTQASIRTPGYADIWCAWADVEFWDGHPDTSLEKVENGLQRNPADNELLARKARSLIELKQENEAKEIIERVLTSDPQNEIALTLKNKWLTQ